MAKFLLWNVQRKRLDRLVVELVEAEGIDVVMLVERPAVLPPLTAAFAHRGFVVVTSEDRFAVYAKPEIGLTPYPLPVPPIRANVYRWVGGSQLDGLMALVHGHDRRNKSDGTRAAYLRGVVAAVREAEVQLGHKRSIILGDFNANPFDPAVVGANGLHALGIRQVRGRTNRTFLGQEADFFYNPMWRLFGHGRDAGGATHHFAGYDEVELIWHMLDQVVIRPEALDRFPEHELKIFTRIGTTNLWDAVEVPDTEAASDHLPVIFRWDL
ncbi:MAG: endonuclease/exonuclease/phosphatase family protein [Gemmataceae bacterium]